MEAASGQVPSPLGARTHDELVARLRELRVKAKKSIRETHRLVDELRQENGRGSLGFETVRRCFEYGRTRIESDLVADIAQVLLGNKLRSVEWRQVCEAIEAGAGQQSVVRVDTTFPAVDFVGRDEEIRQVLTASSGNAVVLIHGMPGTGKTALAAHCARLVERASGPARRLAVNLRGYDSASPPADPAAALDGFLRAAGISAHRFAGQSLQTRRSLLATALGDQPVVVLLDNARHADQVEPLVPTVPHSVVLVTSRHHLDLPDAVRLRLEPLTATDALELLRSQIGAELVDRAPEVAADVVELAGRNPLALRLIAGRIREYGDVTLADHRDWLVDDRERGRIEDRVELAFRSSYRQFPAAVARLLRLVSLHPGHDLDGYAAAALAGVSHTEVTEQLQSLAAASMLEPLESGRYQLHDLVRAFAAEEARRGDPPPVREAAIGRLLDYYRFAAAKAMDAYSPHDRARRPSVSPIELPVPEFADREAARAWLDAEYANLVDVADRSRAHAVDLSSILFAYLDDAAHHRDALRLHTQAETVAAGVERGRVLVNLGATSSQLGRYDDAIGFYEQALVVHRENGDRAGEGRAHGNLGITNAELGRTLEAIDHLEQAVSIHREVGNRLNEAIASGNLCHLFQLIGKYDDARAFGQHQLRVARELGHRVAEGVALGNLGNVERSEGRHELALDLHGQALAIARETGIRGQEIDGLNDLATDLRLLSRPEEAQRRHREALALATRHGNLMQQAKAHEGIGRCLLHAKDGAAARPELAEALRIYSELGVPAAGELTDLLASLS
ncbi:tetratricopeptide repeat protein [Tenggerimyces flavus]|uniref:Tetratricopeptide repeat protein n=1 Tax=Tenggerimyces flavus TaxID=1708749 RepID=A0ABV7YHF6_9ACTN|nr:tetratricopeptide repeat protein [Tenggerimyces flavus]MBM7788031.1 tetratricopeptide (TPR) repeat protein [Tenggerimyces flavus]